MRVLFASLASVGHTYPLIPLAIAARDAGHEVHFAAGEDVHAPLAANGLRPFRPADSFYEVYAEDLEPELARLQPDLVVHEWGLPGAAIAAARAGIPGIWHGFGRMIREGIGLELPTKNAEAPDGRTSTSARLPCRQGLSRHRRPNRTASRPVFRTSRTARVQPAQFEAADLPDARYHVRNPGVAHHGHRGVGDAGRARGGRRRPSAPGATRPAGQRHRADLGATGCG
jgi:hypothetical protein